MSDLFRTTPLEGVTTSALASLREALQRNGMRAPRAGGDVHMAVRSVVAEARAAGVPVEQVIIHVKREWHSLGLNGPSVARAEGLAVTERLVAICLDEYFKEQ